MATEHLRALLLALSAAVLPAAEGGLALGPALILLRDVATGRTVDLAEEAKLQWDLLNQGAVGGTFEVAALAPASYGFADYERGYEPLPDSRWLAIEPGSADLAPGTATKLRLRISIPEAAEHYNRHWIAYIESGPPAKAALGANLRLRARVMIETPVRAPQPGVPIAGGEIALAPAEVAMTPQGAAWTGSVRMRNGSARAAVFDLLRVHDLHPGELDKGIRFFQIPERAVLGEAWMRGEPDAGIALEAGAEIDLPLAARDRAVPAGKRRDEVVFVARRALPGAAAPEPLTVGGVAYDRLELLRLRYQAPEAATP